MGALIRTANQFKNSDFPTPRGYEQAVHPPPSGNLEQSCSSFFAIFSLQKAPSSPAQAATEFQRCGEGSGGGVMRKQKLAPLWRFANNADAGGGNKEWQQLSAQVMNVNGAQFSRHCPCLSA